MDISLIAFNIAICCYGSNELRKFKEKKLIYTLGILEHHSLNGVTAQNTYSHYHTCTYRHRPENTWSYVQQVLFNTNSVCVWVCVCV